MQKFIVLYKVPVAVLDIWMHTSKEVKDAEEQKMQQEWSRWMETNAPHLLETISVGKPTILTQTTVIEGRNDIMMYSLVQADNVDIVKQMFVGHPHLQIPEASIEVMSVRNI